MTSPQKSTVAEIRERFDREVERFSNLETGQVATVDAALALDLVASAAAAACPGAHCILDVGCGAGNYSLKLRERLPNARFSLVDLSRPMLDRAQQRLGPSAEATYQEDIRELERPAESVDIIVAAAVLHHLRTDAEWSATMQKFFRWLRPGGGLWIFDLVDHEHASVQSMMWHRYGAYLQSINGEKYRDNVFAYVQKEDTPRPVTFQLEQMRAAGFSRLDVLHKNSCFAAFGGSKPPSGNEHLKTTR